MKKNEIVTTPEIRFGMSYLDEEVYEYYLSIPVSNFPAGVSIAMPIALPIKKNMALKVLGERGYFLFQNLFTCEGISRVEMHPRLIRIWRNDDISLDIKKIERFVLDNIRKTYQKFGYREIKLVHSHDAPGRMSVS